MNRKKSGFKALLHESNDMYSHHSNIQMLIEVYKIKNELALVIMDSMLNRRNIIYNFRTLLLKFQLETKRTDFYGLVLSTLHPNHGYFYHRKLSKETR